LEDFIISILDDTFNGFNDTIKAAISIVSQSPTEFNSAIATSMENIYHVILPIGYTLLVLFFLLEFLNKSIMFETKSVEMVVSMFLKLIIAKIVMEHSLDILYGIFDFSSYIAGLIGSIAIEDTMVELDGLKENVGNMRFGEKLMFYIALQPMSLIMQLIEWGVFIIIYGRIIELFLYIALAPIPISTLTSSSYQNVGRSYIQGFAGVALQGPVIIVCVAIYSLLFTSVLVDVGDTVTSGMRALRDMIGISLVLLGVLAKSGTWAKKLVSSI